MPSPFSWELYAVEGEIGVEYSATLSSITPVISQTNTTISTTSTILVWSGDQTPAVIIPGASLETGKKYLILYSLCYGMNDVDAECDIYVADANTAYAHARGEGNDHPATPFEPMRTSQLAGYYIYTGAGIDLEFAYKCRTSSDELFIKGMTLIAVPLEDLTEGTDYLYSQLNQDAPEVARATWTSTDTWVDILSETLTVPSTGDYLVLASAEGTSTDAGATSGTAFRFTIDGETQKEECTKEKEDEHDIHSFSYARVHNLTAGDVTFALQGGSMKGTDNKEYWRPRIILIRAGTFDQIDVATDDGYLTSTNSIADPVWAERIAKSYTPSQSEYVIVIANLVNQRSGTGSSAYRLRNHTDSTSLVEYISDASQAGDYTEKSSISLFSGESIGLSKEYRIETASEDAATAANEQVISNHVDIIIWGMSLAGTSPPQDDITVQDGISAGEALTKTVGVTYASSTGVADNYADVLGGHLQPDSSTSVGDKASLVIEGDVGTRPWLLLNATRLAQLQTNMAAVTQYWTSFSYMAAERLEAWHWALLYKLTGNVTYKNYAISNSYGTYGTGVMDIVGLGPEYIFAFDTSYLYYRDFMRNVALTYDWLYDELDQSQRSEIVNYLNFCTYTAWMGTAEAKALIDLSLIQTYNPAITKFTNDWAIHTVNQNYFSNYMLGSLYVALATYGENPGGFTHDSTWYPLSIYFNGYNANDGVYTDLLELWQAKLDRAFVQWDARCEGGGWLEGSNYGRAALRHQAEMFLILKKFPLASVSHDYFFDPAHPHMKDTAIWQLYYGQGNGKILFQAGDAGGAGDFQVHWADRHLMLLLTHGLEGTTEGSYARWWCENIKTAMSGSTVMIPWDFFLDEPTMTSTDFTAMLPTQYLATGIDWVHSRSDWTSDASCFSFISADNVRNHQHKDQNNVQMYRGEAASPIDGWQVTDAMAFSNKSDYSRATKLHNTFLIYGTGQNTDAYNETDHFYTPKSGYDRIGQISKYEAGIRYTYAQGDARHAYYTNPGTNSWGDTQMTQYFFREFVHIFNDYCCVFDRICLTDNLYNPVLCLWHYPYNQPTTAGPDVYKSTNDAGMVFHRVLLPANREIYWVDEDEEAKTVLADAGARVETWRMMIKDATTGVGPNNYTQYLFHNCFQLAAAGTAQPTTMARVTSNDGVMEGVHIRDATEHALVMFSTRIDASAPTNPFYYNFTLDGTNHRHYIFNLVPSGTYDASFLDFGTFGRVTITPGGSTHTASDQGVLVIDDWTTTNWSVTVTSSVDAGDVRVVAPARLFGSHAKTHDRMTYVGGGTTKNAELSGSMDADDAVLLGVAKAPKSSASMGDSCTISVTSREKFISTVAWSEKTIPTVTYTEKDISQ